MNMSIFKILMLLQVLRLSATGCADNSEHAENCASWTVSGYCYKGSEYYEFMTANCPRTCGVCEVEEGWISPKLQQSYSLELSQTLELKTTMNQVEAPITVYFIFPEDETQYINFKCTDLNSSRWILVIQQCMPDSWDAAQPLNGVSSDQIKVWRITRTETSLLVECNGVTVLIFNFASDYKDGFSSCHSFWTRHSTAIKFNWSGGLYKNNGHLSMRTAVYKEYEILIVEKGTGSSLGSEYVGMFVPRDTDVCNTRAYLHYTTKTLFYYTPTHWCFTSTHYNTIKGCSNGLGYFYTNSFKNDPLKSTFNTPINIYEGCFVPDVHKATEVRTSVTNGARVGEEITVSCPDLGDRKFLCQTGNTWEPPDVAGACLVGPQGEQGAEGEQGNQGATGRKGAQGTNDFCSSVGWICSLEGAEGEPGEDGADGENGPTGDSGDVGAKGEMGREGTPGFPGLSGVKGIKGGRGIDGQDSFPGWNGQQNCGSESCSLRLGPCYGMGSSRFTVKCMEGYAANGIWRNSRFWGLRCCKIVVK
ncbi:uncharacterized protein LOC134815005 isoform X2 [Bolinopsis microptera]|uniref:uncharacterized protein LOC134815005 isoform X2 n=1 Tax=Bolinopsis microptera TaxID=2820187 RepID=UPI00307ADC3C